MPTGSRLSLFPKQVNDKDSRTPWVATAARAGELPPWQRLRPRGGKMDDITVVVALVNKG